MLGVPESMGLHGTSSFKLVTVSALLILAWSLARWIARFSQRLDGTWSRKSKSEEYHRGLEPVAPGQRQVGRELVSIQRNNPPLWTTTIVFQATNCASAGDEARRFLVRSHAEMVWSDRGQREFDVVFAAACLTASAAAVLGFSLAALPSPHELSVS